MVITSLMKAKDKSEINKVVGDLIRRRKEHEGRIEKLLGRVKEDPSRTYNSLHDISQMLKQLDEGEKIVPGPGIDMGNHVNLLATVTLKTECHLPESAILSGGQLVNSLKQQFQFKKLNISLDPKLPGPRWLKEISAYLNTNDLAEGLFSGSQDPNDFVGSCFAMGKYEQVLLSMSQLQENQRQLVMFDAQTQQLQIGSLLLSRLLAKPMLLPQALNRLFSFPIKSYNFHKSEDLINLLSNGNNLSAIAHFGIYENDRCQQVRLPNKRALKLYPALLNKYSQIWMVDQTELQVKSLSLSCLVNHFVVVTLLVAAPGNYFINVGGTDPTRRYRVCLMSEEYSIIQWQEVRSGQHIECALKAEEYELYISPVAVDLQEGELDESSELVREKTETYAMWVQGNYLFNQHGDLQLQLRLKEQYNRYTHKISTIYREAHDVDKPEELLENEGKVLVVRQHLAWMHLIRDNYHFPSCHSQLTAHYPAHTLTDQHSQQCEVRLKAPVTSVTLYQPTPITKLTSGSVGQQSMPFKVVSRYY